MDLTSLSSAELLALHSRIAEELRERGVVRSSNTPTGDLAEHLFCRAFDWEQAGNSNPSIDATAKDGTRYQIKARRFTDHNKSRHLSALRNLPDEGFDYLAAVLFNSDYTVKRAAIIPHALIMETSRYVKHTNSWKFMLRDEVWTWTGVEDVTEQLKSVSL